MNSRFELEGRHPPLSDEVQTVANRSVAPRETAAVRKRPRSLTPGSGRSSQCGERPLRRDVADEDGPVIREGELPRGFRWEWNEYYQRYVCDRWKALKPFQREQANAASYARRLAENPMARFDFVLDAFEDSMMSLSSYEFTWIPKLNRYQCHGWNELSESQQRHMNMISYRRTIFNELRKNRECNVAGVEKMLMPSRAGVRWNAGSRLYEPSSRVSLTADEERDISDMTELRRALMQAENLANRSETWAVN